MYKYITYYVDSWDGISQTENKGMHAYDVNTQTSAINILKRALVQLCWLAHTIRKQ